MKQILIYGDSLSWGIIPGTRQRLSFDKRWPGVLEAGLNDKGHDHRVIENCLNGRRTVWEDPFKAGRNGLAGLEQLVEVHSPLALIIIMLGTNDFQSSHNNTAWHSARGLATVITTIRRAPIEPGMLQPPVLVVAPPEVTAPTGDTVEKFRGAELRCRDLARHMETVAGELDCSFMDAGRIIKPSPIDGVHLDEAAHKVLGQALTMRVKTLLKEE